VVEVKRRVTPIAPIAYRFPTARLYYPLRITRLEHGRGKLRLLLVTPRGVDFPVRKHQLRVGKRKRRFACYREVAPLRLGRRSLKRIDKDIAQLMATRRRAALSQWRCAGTLAAADFDLLGVERPARRPRKRPSKRRRTKSRRSKAGALDSAF
jgi:hypothetical protein